MPSMTTVCQKILPVTETVTGLSPYLPSRLNDSGCDLKKVHKSQRSTRNKKKTEKHKGFQKLPICCQKSDLAEPL